MSCLYDAWITYNYMDLNNQAFRLILEEQNDFHFFNVKLDEFTKAFEYGFSKAFKLCDFNIGDEKQ